MNKTKAYQIVMYFWAVVFFCVGLIFLLTPSSFFDLVDNAARLCGLAGAIATPEYGLWYTLAISYMVCLVLLSFFATRRPTDCILSSIIVLAKIVSVMGFTWLAVKDGSVWFVCAVADCFVVLTIILVMPKKV